MFRADCMPRLLLGFGCWLAWSVAMASGGVLSGSLSRWLDAEAAPALAQTLSQHPRFKGETIRVVAMRDGKPTAESNRLTRAVQQRLTRELLRANGVRIAWGDEAEECAPPRAIPLLLGIEIESAGAGNHRLHLGVVDVEEGLWVSGVSLTWKGRLSSGARAALTDKVKVGAPGTLQNPLPIADRVQVGKLLQVGLGCTLPSGLDGAVFVEPAQQAGLDSVTRTLARELSKTSLTNITVDREAATWLIGVHARPAGGAHELVLTLRDVAGERASQQLAAVMVTGLQASVAAVAQTPPLPADDALVGPLRLRPAARKGICFGGDACVEVGFRLTQPAYVMVLSSQSQRLRPRSCGLGIKQSQPGERWYRVRVTSAATSPSRPDAGFYVLAIAERSLAHSVAAHLNRLCAQSSGVAPMSQWLGELERLLQRDAGAVDWQSVHLSRTPSGVVRL